LGFNKKYTQKTHNSDLNKYAGLQFLTVHGGPNNGQSCSSPFPAFTKSTDSLPLLADYGPDSTTVNYLTYQPHTTIQPPSLFTLWQKQKLIQAKIFIIFQKYEMAVLCEG
jgi:hypothetical protein